MKATLFIVTFVLQLSLAHQSLAELSGLLPLLTDFTNLR